MSAHERGAPRKAKARSRGGVDVGPSWPPVCAAKLSQGVVYGAGIRGVVRRRLASRGPSSPADGEEGPRRAASPRPRAGGRGPPCPCRCSAIGASEGFRRPSLGRTKYRRVRPRRLRSRRSTTGHEFSGVRPGRSPTPRRLLKTAFRSITHPRGVLRTTFRSITHPRGVLRTTFRSLVHPR
jgi:hypothetical protein